MIPQFDLTKHFTHPNSLGTVFNTKNPDNFNHLTIKLHDYSF